MGINSFVDWFIHDKLTQNGDDYSRSKVFIGFSLSLSVAVMIYSIVYFILRQHAGGYVIIGAGFMFFFSALIVKTSGALNVAANILVASFFVTIAVLGYLGGGVPAISSPWFAAVALSGILIAGNRAGLFWGGCSVAVLVIMFLVRLNDFVFSTTGLSVMENETFQFIALAGLVVITMAFGLVFSVLIAKMVKKTKESNQITQQNMDRLKDLVGELENVMADITVGDFSRRLEVTETNDDISELKSRLNVPLTMLTSIISKVVDISGNVDGGSRDLSQSAQNLSSGSTQQAAAMEEITSSLVEVEKQASKNHQSAREAFQLIEKSFESVNVANGNMSGLLGSMQKISKTSSKVTGVIKTIDEIAFQTNLLALNAAVEAARAGKYGKGFAVVAEEVRNLASRSATAAKNTTELIDSSVKEIDEGVKKSTMTSESLKLISEEVEKVKTIVKDVAEASAEQNSGIREINSGLTQISSVVQSNTAIAEETASTAEDLLSQAGKLQYIVKSFQG